MFTTTANLLTLLTLALTPLATTAAKISLTQIPAVATIGQPSTITWSGGDSTEPVTLTLLEGSISSPRTIAIIGQNLAGSSFTWTPASGLTPNDDYLLEIQQGLEDPNFSGQFSIQNASAAQATTIYAVAGSSTIAISTVLPNSTSSASASTSTSTVLLQGGSTVTSAAASASGTGGISMARNTTFVTQNLTSMGTATMGSATTTVASTTTTATTGSSAGGAVARATAQAVLGFGAVAAAAMYLL